MGKAISKAKEIAAENAENTAASAAGITTDEAGEALASAAAALAQQESEAPAVTLDELESMDAFELEVTLHAIGTNDGGPDKAKGSAWTYCLKYYLFEKFGIDQGDDDPDMQDHTSEGRQQAPQTPTQPQNGAQGRNTQPAPPNAQNGHTGASRPLSDAQLSRMYRKGEDAGLNQQQVNARILQKYGQQDPHNLTRQQYDEICTALDNAKQGGTANV